jgi:CHAT domain-containing protein/tetratricopeptide (TPR) repeat protein
LSLAAGMLAAFLAAGTLRAIGQNPAPPASRKGHQKTPPKTPGRIPKAAAGARAAKQVEAARALRRKLTASDMKAAIILFEESARQFQASGLPLEAAQAEREAGDTYFMTSRYAAALEAYRHALNFAGADPEARCNVFSHMARTYATKGKLVEAKRYSERALSLCEEHSDPRTRADALEALGETRFWSSDMDGALESLGQARTLFVEANDSDGQALTLLMLAYARVESDRAEALHLAGDALNRWKSNGDVYGVAKARMALALFASVAGESELARCNCGEAYRVFHAMGDKDNEAIALNISGRVARETGDVQSSLDNYRQARAAFASVQDQLGEAEAINGMGAALTTLRRYQQLLPLYSRKFRLAQQVGNRALMASALLNMADVHQLEHDYARAEASYLKALAIDHSIGQTYGEGDVLVRMGYLRVAQGDDSQAISLLERALQLRQANSQVEDIARIQYEMARIHYRLRQWDQALSRIEETIQIIESQRLRIAKFDSRAQYFAAVHQYYSLFIRILMGLHELHPEQPFMQRAFEASEKSKVRSLLDLLSSSSQASPCEEMLGSRSDSSSPRSAQDNADPNAASLAKALTLEQVQADVADIDSVLVEYALGDETSYVWVIDRNKIVAYSLPPSQQIRKLAQSFREDLMPLEPHRDETFLEYDRRERAATGARRGRARQLAQVLLGKLNIENGKRVLIVPDGCLQYIPFSALPLLGPKDDHRFFLEQHDIVVLPSASALAALRTAAAKRAPPTADVAILADPVFGKSQEHPVALKRALRDTQGFENIPPLPGSRREALAIQKILGPGHALVALGFDANRDFVLRGSVSSFRVLHFATHGIIDTRRPEMSGLILSLVNPSGEYQDGYLRLGDIYKLNLSADLVVLSSCESALGKELEAEGIIGLPRGFLYAGARSVIASLWKVDDEATATLMKGLYIRMHRGESPNTALRGAQLALAKDKRYSKPYYWAAFVLQGDYK